MIIKYLLVFILFCSTLNAKSKNVYVKNIKIGSKINVYLINKNLYDITVLYNARTESLISTNDLPMEVTVHARTKKLINSYLVKGRRYTINSIFKYTIGSKYSIHDDTYLYRLPYKLGTSKMVTQSFNGYFSHKGNSRFAVDFGMKIGTKIYAARGGIVVATKSDGSKSGNRKYIKDANFILIRHNDGTYAKYAHLRKRGVRVKIGQKVKRGKFIGYSGNTGYTNGPHLHFIVFKGKSHNQRDSIPIKFISTRGVIYKPIRGNKYKAVKLQQIKRRINNGLYK